MTSRRRRIDIVLSTALVAAVVTTLSAGHARPSTDASGDPAEAFEAANTAFAEGRYDEAADEFAAIVAGHGVSAALLFNLGNASFRAGRIGDAVLAYQQALVLEPRSSSIAANLRQVRGAANLPPPDADVLRAAVAWLPADDWARLASACLVIACGALATARLLRARLTERANALRGLRTAATVALVAMSLGAGAAWYAIRLLDRSVVVGDGLALRVAPYPSATTSSPVAMGEIVTSERVHEGFTLVRTADGRSGWLPAEHVRRVGDLPAASPPPRA